MSRLEEEYNRLKELSDGELDQLVRLLCDLIRTRYDEKSRLAAAQLITGQLVVSCSEQMRSEIPVGAVGKVLSKKKARVVVDFGSLGKCSIPAHFVKPAADGAIMPAGSQAEVSCESVSRR